MTGAVVSFTVIVCVQLELLPDASVAFHVRVIVLACGQLPAVVVSLKVTSTPGQLSLAVAVPVAVGLVDWSHSIVLFGGQAICGFSSSLTVTVKPHAAVLPLASVAVQFTVVAPFG